MWTQLINMVLGIWLMAAPAALGFSGPAATNAHAVGPTIATFALVAVWGVARGLRWVNVPLGLWLVAAPWLIDHTTAATINSIAVGAAVVGLSLPRGRVRHTFGGGWTPLFTSAASNAIPKRA